MADDDYDPFRGDDEHAGYRVIRVKLEEDEAAWEWQHKDGTRFRVTAAPDPQDWRCRVLFFWWSRCDGSLAELPVPDREWLRAVSEEVAAATIRSIGWTLALQGFVQVA